MTLFIGVLAALAWCVWRLVARLRHRSARDPHRIQGTATARDIDAAASKKALVRRGATLRPSIQHPRASDVGYLIGRSCGREIWASVEDSILVIGPPRSGKGLHLVINAILDAPGAVVTTSTRPDNIAATIDARKERGPVAVFDPQHLTAGLPAVGGNGVRWSPIRGCEQPLTAMIRASGLASSTGLSSGGTESGGFWEGKARSALQALLHAAALEQLPTRALFEWSLSASAATDAVGILASHPHAAAGWSDSLEGMISSDPRTRDSIWMAVAQALSCLADPAVLDAVSPEPGEEFDPRDFLDPERHALPARHRRRRRRLVATRRRVHGRPHRSRPPPRRRVTRVPPRPAPADGARRDRQPRPAPLPARPDGRGRRHRHHHDARPPVARPGAQQVGRPRRQHDLGRLDRQGHPRRRVRLARPPGAVRADRRTRRTLRHRHHRRLRPAIAPAIDSPSAPVMPPERIRTLPFGTGLVLLRSAPPIVTTFVPGPIDDGPCHLSRVARTSEASTGLTPSLRDPGLQVAPRNSLWWSIIAATSATTAAFPASCCDRRASSARMVSSWTAAI